MALAHAHRTSGHTASPSASASASRAAAAATMIASSPPPSPARPPPPPPVGPWGRYSSCRAFVSDLAAVLAVLVCFSCVALCLHYAARILLRCLDRHRRRRRASREAAQEHKPPSDAVDGASPVVAGVWAEAECAICLAELDLEGGERVRVLPACGHGFHAACVEAWLATRASCPTCRAPSSRPPRTTRAP